MITQMLLFAILGFIGSVIATPILISIMQRNHLYQPRRSDGPQTHLQKGKVPPAGGIVFWLGLALMLVTVLIKPVLPSAFVSYDKDIRLVLICAISGALILGLIGFLDDLNKITSQKTRGIPARFKLLIQIAVPMIAVYIVTTNSHQFKPGLLLYPGGSIEMPLWLVFCFSLFCFMGIINGMNFLDGLDGLAGGSSVVTFLALGLCTRLDNSLSGFTAGLVGGFLVFNIKPAKIYMGDTGSYTLGALLGLICILEGLHIFLVIGCLLYAIEVLSVVLQVSSFKLTGKRILKMSPIHHHFELSGWSEWKVVLNFWVFNAIVSIIAVLALSTLMPYNLSTAINTKQRVIQIPKDGFDKDSIQYFRKYGLEGP